MKEDGYTQTPTYTIVDEILVVNPVDFATHNTEVVFIISVVPIDFHNLL